MSGGNLCLDVDNGYVSVPIVRIYPKYIRIIYFTVIYMYIHIYMYLYRYVYVCIYKCMYIYMHMPIYLGVCLKYNLKIELQPFKGRRAGQVKLQRLRRR